jgi:glycosyltransferase involved in cell wall biosynthesis
MARLAIVTSSPPSVEGGHLVVARSLEAAAREAGHDAHVLITPECQFGRQASSYIETWRTDVNAATGHRIDQVISLRFPSYAVRHPAHVCWLNHTMREYYDQWPRFSAGLSSRGRAKERVKRLVIRTVDRWLLTHNVTRVIAQSRTVQRRLADDFGIGSAVVLPPPPQRAYRSEGYGDFVFAVSRLTPLKRLDLFIRALAQPAAGGVKAVIAGDGDQRRALEELVKALGLMGRVTFLGRVTEETLLDHLAKCRAVCFPPVAEDYGFVTVEAFASRKSVLTCFDSGGAAEMVQDGKTGLVCSPTPEALAAAIARVMANAAFAEQMGTAAADWVATLTWPETVKRLVIV